MASESADERWEYLPDGVAGGPDAESIRQLVALGGLVQESSGLELSLRMLFCALLDSKYAAVTAAGQNASWLIENCRATVKRRSDIAVPQQTMILDLLSDAAGALERRNRFVHDVWVDGPDSWSLMRSKRRDHALGMKPVTTDDVAATVGELRRCSARIIRWLGDVLPAGLSLEAQLRLEDELRENDGDR